MSLNRKCPKCGGEKVQLSSERSKHGFFWLLLFWWYYITLVCIKWMIGLMIICCWDWWMSIIAKSQNKGYVWQGKKWFSGTKKIYYCHDCGNNFRA